MSNVKNAKRNNNRTQQIMMYSYTAVMAGYKCKYCGEKFAKPLDLARHVRMKHKRAIKGIVIAVGFILAISTLPPALAAEPLSELVISPDNIEQVTQLELLETRPAKQVEWSPDGKLLAVVSYDIYIYLFDTQTFQPKRLINAGLVDSVAFSPDGTTLASTSFDSVKLWDVAGGGEKNALEVLSSVEDVAFAPNGEILAVSVGNTVKLFNTKNWEEMDTFIGHSSYVNSVDISPDGTILASGSIDGVKLWDMKTGSELRTLTRDWVNSVAFSPDGKILASGAYDKTAKLWDVASGCELYTFTGHTEDVRSVAFSPDGKILASASGDVKLWDVASGAELRTLKGYTKGVWSVAFSPDGKILASAEYWSETVRLWGIRSTTPIPTPSFVPIPTPSFVPIPTPSFVPIPTPSPTPTAAPTPSIEDQFQQWLQNRPKGKIVSNPPEEMIVDSRERVEVGISWNITNETLTQELKGRGESKIAENITVSQYMKVVLEGKNFEIEIQGGTEKKTVEPGKPTIWTFWVTPKKSGRQTLILTVFITYMVEGLPEPMQTDVKVYEYDVRVKVNPPYTVTKFLSDYWQWIATTILIPIVLWWWRKKRSSKGEG